jgi:hypothetical protein
MGPIEKPWLDFLLVESPDNPYRDHQMEKRESPLVELSGKLCEVQALNKRLIGKVLFEEN